MTARLGRSSLADFERRASGFLEIHCSTRKCMWCQDPERGIHRKGLCSHCYRIERQIAKGTAEVDRLKRIGQPRTIAEWELRSAEAKAGLAKQDGKAYGNISTRQVTGGELRAAFAYLSKELARTDLFRGLDTVFDHGFSPNQKGLLLHLLSKIIRARRRKNRFHDALVRVHRL